VNHVFLLHAFENPSVLTSYRHFFLAETGLSSKKVINADAKKMLSFFKHVWAQPDKSTQTIVEITYLAGTSTLPSLPTPPLARVGRR
jgi:hypothetical protein